jgi:hypothetical protein
MRPVRRDTRPWARSHRDGCLGTALLATEEAIVFAMLAEALRGTLPK